MARKVKKCTKCKKFKSISSFQNNATTKDGLQFWCKFCKNAINKRWKNKNPEKARLSVRNWELANPEKSRANVYKWKRNNPDKVKKSRVEWARRNKHKKNAKEAKRRAAKLNATPPWLSKEQLLAIENIYERATLITQVSGIPHEVDHIVPLLGKNVRGLHVPWNLRVISASKNAKKSNKHEFQKKEK